MNLIFVSSLCFSTAYSEFKENLSVNVTAILIFKASWVPQTKGFEHKRTNFEISERKRTNL
jgi:hypothetical protein